MNDSITLVILKGQQKACSMLARDLLPRNPQDRALQSPKQVQARICASPLDLAKRRHRTQLLQLRKARNSRQGKHLL